MARAIDSVLVVFMCYFVLMNVTVERCYCHAPLTATDKRFLMPETWDFVNQHNPLFLARPFYMQMATCISAYGFLPFYIIIAIAAVYNRWAALSTPIVLFIGAKAYAIGFYHLMEFTSETPPPNLMPYFAAELPYIISIGLVLMQLWRAKSTGIKPKPKAT